MTGVVGTASNAVVLELGLGLGGGSVAVTDEMDENELLRECDSGEFVPSVENLARSLMDDDDDS